MEKAKFGADVDRQLLRLLVDDEFVYSGCLYKWDTHRMGISSV